MRRAWRAAGYSRAFLFS